MTELRGGPADPGALAVLDTNVVLDWLVFADVRVRALQRALVGGALTWIATEAMFEELADVLGRPAITRCCPDPAATLALARARCRLVAAVPAAADPAPRCADPDDQIFIDLAWSQPAGWLFSRDRALLALARPALARGLVVTTPADWAGPHTEAGLTG